MGPRKLSILFSGMIAGDPRQGGATWAVLQYLQGLRQLGHDVCFVEPVKPTSLKPAAKPSGAGLAESDNADYFRQVSAEFGLEGSAALLLNGSRQTVGLDYDELRRRAEGADVLVNISGMLRDPELTGPPPVRVYLDLDPAFIQLWHAVEGIDMGFDGHTHFVTVGQAIGTPGCPVPTCGRQWVPTFQPVVLGHWPAVGPEGAVEYDGFTTVANFRGYGSIDYQGVQYGQKVHSLRKLMALPTLCGQKFMPALAIDPAETRDLAALAANGWRLLDPARLTGTPGDYRRFVQRSKAEIGIAKSGYVASRCGWFSDRSACYLASGRPVLAQDTGFGQFLPTGDGLLRFDSADQAAAGAEAIATHAADYARHARAARALAERFFDSDRVLGRLLREIGVGP